MKKGKKIWNRLLSLVLCLVMVTGMFAGMGMEAKAAIPSLYKRTFTVTAEDFAGNNLDTNGAHIEVTGYFYRAGENITIDGVEYIGGVYTTIHYDLSGGKTAEIDGVAKGANQAMLPFEYTFNCYHRRYPDTHPDVVACFAEYDVPTVTSPLTGNYTIKLSRKNVNLTVDLKNSSGVAVTSGVTVSMNGQSDNEAPYIFSGLKEGSNYNISVSGNGYSFNKNYYLDGTIGGKNRSTTLDIGDRKFTVRANVALEGEKVKWFSNGKVYAGSEELTKEYNTDGYYFRKTLLAGKYTLTASGIAGVTVESKEIDINDSDATVELKANLKTPEITGGTTVKCGEKLDLGVKESVEYWKANYTWKSSNESVATIDANGVIAPLKVGTTNITVTCSYGKQSKTSDPVTITVEKGEATHPAGASIVGDDFIDQNVVTIKVPENRVLQPGDKAIVTVKGDYVENGSYTTAPLVISDDRTVEVDLEGQLKGTYLQGEVNFDLKYSSENYNYNSPPEKDSISAKKYYITVPLDINLYADDSKAPADLVYGDVRALSIKAANSGVDNTKSQFTYAVSDSTVINNIANTQGASSYSDGISTIASGLKISNAGTTKITVTRAQDETNYWAEASDEITVNVAKREIDPLAAVYAQASDEPAIFDGKTDYKAVGNINSETDVNGNGLLIKADADKAVINATLELPSADADTYNASKGNISIGSGYELKAADGLGDFITRNYTLKQVSSTETIQSSEDLVVAKKKIDPLLANYAKADTEDGVYDGETSYEAVGTVAAADGNDNGLLIAKDAGKAVIKATLVLPSKDVGTYQAPNDTIKIGNDFVLTAADVDAVEHIAKNYELKETAATAEITKSEKLEVVQKEIAPLTTVTYANKEKPRYYDGTETIEATGTVAVQDGTNNSDTDGKLVAGDTEKVTVNATLKLPNKDADTYNAPTDEITIESYSLSGDEAKNYKLPETVPTDKIETESSLIIEPRPLTITIANGNGENEFALNYQDLDNTTFNTLSALNAKTESTADDLEITLGNLADSEQYGTDVSKIDDIVSFGQETVDGKLKPLDVNTDGYQDKIRISMDTANGAVPLNDRGKKNYVFNENDDHQWAKLIINAETITGALDENVTYGGKNIWVDVKDTEDDILWIQSQYGLLKIDYTEKYNNRYDSVIKANEPSVNLDEKGIESTALQDATSIDVQFAVKTAEDTYKNNSNPYTVPYKLDGTAPVVSPYKFVENQTIFSRIAGAWGFDQFTKSVYTAEFTVTDEGSGFTHDDVEVYVYKLSDTDLTNGVVALETVKEKVAALNDTDWAKATHVADNKYSVKVAEAAPGQTDIIEGSYLVFARVTDNVNNRAVYASNGIVVEGTAPQIQVTFKPEKDYYNSDVKYVIDVTDLGYEGLEASGLKEVSWTVYVDGQEVTELAGKTAADFFDCVDADGEYTLDELKKAYTSGELTILAEKCNSNDVVLKVTATDKAGNVATEEYPIMIDTTEPEISVKYDLNDPENTNFFSEARTAVVTFTERNFDKSKATFNLTVDGKSYKNVTLSYINENIPGVKASWGKDSQADRDKKDYTDDRTVKATIVFYGENAYSNFEPNCVDKAANENSVLTYAKTTAKGTETTFTIDKTAPSVEILNVELDKVNVGSASPIIKVYDTNRGSVSIRLIDKYGDDVTEKYLDTEESGGGTYVFKEVGKDVSGIYRILVSAADKAGHEILWAESFYVWHEGEAVPAAPTTGTVAATGDNADILLWCVVLAVAAVSGVIVVKKRRNKES